MANKLWEKNVKVNADIDRFTVGRDREMDLFLAPYDVLGSIAHITMLESIGLLTAEELNTLTAELRHIYQDIENGNFRIEDDVEDVHSQVELLLTRQLGDMGKKIHSGRSRNDQVLVDLKLYTRDQLKQVAQKTHKLFEELQVQSERNKHFLLAVMMEYYCFIRPDELSNIRIGDIDAKAHAIYVRAEISKNGKAEMVGLNNAVLSLMRELHVLRSPKDWYLFSVRCRPGATKLHSRMFRERWARLRKRLDLPKEYQFYSLKDSGIRDLANAEGIVIARDQARHSSVAVTNKYLQGRDRPVHKETIRFKGAL